MATRQPELKAKIQSAGTDPRNQAQASGMARWMVPTLATNLFIAAVALVSGPLAARILGPSGRGDLAAVQNIYWLTALISLLGLSEGTLFFVARSPAKSGQILSTSACLVAASAPVCMLIGYFVVPIVLRGQSQATMWIARMSLLFILVSSWLSLVQFAIRGMNKIFEWNISRGVPALGWMLTLMVVAFFRIASVSAIMFAYIGVLALSLVIGLALFLPRVGDQRGMRPDLSLAKPLLGYGIPLVCASVPQTLNLRLDQLLIASMLPAPALGLYVVAVGWSGAITPLLHAIANLLFPRIAGSASLEDSAYMFGRVIRIGGMAALVLGGLLVAITPAVLPLIFGTAFRPSIFSACILVGASAISGINVILEEGLRGLGNTWAILTSEGVGLISTVISLIYLLPRQGIVGAAIGSVLGYAVTSIVLIFCVLRVLNLSWASFLLPRRGDLSYFWKHAAAVIPRLKRVEK
jgi:antigen flippase